MLLFITGGGKNSSLRNLSPLTLRELITVGGDESYKSLFSLL
jgi:hypothetical protein